MSANFTPELNSYTDLTPFRYWCQKVLPLVYDDSLSYYELLCKVIDYLNKTMEDVNLAVEDVGKLHDAYDSLQTYVNTYFENLDVQEEINNKLDEMVEDGTIRNIFSEDVQDILNVASDAAEQAIADIPENVTDWLEEHITQETGYVIDDTLTVQGAAADAKKTGDEISALKSDLSSAIASLATPVDLYPNGAFTSGSISYLTGGTAGSSAFKHTDYVDVSGCTRIVYSRAKTSSTTTTAGMAFYDEQQNFITDSGQQVITGSSESGTWVSQTINVPSSAKYARFSFFTESTDSFYVYDPDHYINVLSDDVDALSDEVDKLSNTIGEIVSATFVKPSSGSAVVNFAYPVKANKKILFYAESEGAQANSSYNLYTRATSSGENVETLYSTAKFGVMYEVTPTTDANYLRVTASRDGAIYVYDSNTLLADVTNIHKDIERIDSDIERIDSDIERIEGEIDELDASTIPFVKFGFTHDMYDPSDAFDPSGEIGNINEWSSKAEALTKVHAAFDALCASDGAGYGERLTGLYKTNVLDEALVDVIAPDYVLNGVTQGQTVSLPIGTDTDGNPVTYNYTYESSTSPYEVRLYRFHDTNSALHTAKVDIPKKKILLVGGTHGNEFCAPINLYLLAKMLCTNFNNPDVLKLRSSFDVYIIPYLNGFGCQYQWMNNGVMTTGTRSNGRLVDINRNCYTAGWVGATGTAEQITAHFESKISNLATNTFAGSSNGSEFESQLVKAVIELIQPDVFIDHHHNSGNAPFYTTCRGNYAGNLIYQAANDSAYARMHNMVQYFGTKYNLFLGSDVSPATKAAANGHMQTMAYELGIKMNAVSEMPESIAYLNGVVDGTTKAATKYSALAFKQAGYTLLSVLLHMCQWALEH